jgi:hypothetical protein
MGDKMKMNLFSKVDWTPVLKADSTAKMADRLRVQSVKAVPKMTLSGASSDMVGVFIESIEQLAVKIERRITVQVGLDELMRAWSKQK